MNGIAKAQSGDDIDAHAAKSVEEVSGLGSSSLALKGGTQSFDLVGT